MKDSPAKTGTTVLPVFTLQIASLERPSISFAVTVRTPDSYAPGCSESERGASLRCWFDLFKFGNLAKIQQIRCFGDSGNLAKKTRCHSFTAFGKVS